MPSSIYQDMICLAVCLPIRESSSVFTNAAMWNNVLLTIKFFDVVKLTTPTLLSLIISCKLAFLNAVWKYLLSTLLHWNLNKVFMQYLELTAYILQFLIKCILHTFISSLLSSAHAHSEQYHTNDPLVLYMTPYH